MNKKAFIIGFIVLLTSFGLFLRTYQIDVIPAALSYDELDNVVNGLSILYTGRDLQGQHFFWELYPVQTHTYTAELSALWHVIPQFPMSVLTIAKLPNIIAGFISSLALGWFSYLVFKKRTIALITFLLMLFSPWNILISRTAYEAPISLMFLLLSMCTFWIIFEQQTVSRKIFSVALTILFMLCSFYTYHGYKFVLPFIYLVLFFWNQQMPFRKFFTKKGILRVSSLFLLSVLFVWFLAFALFGFRLKEGFYGTRSSEISFLNTATIAADVNMQRQLSFDNTLNPIFSNKGTIISTKLTTSFFDSFDPVVLFITGYDKGSMIGLWEHGFLYLLQLPLIVIGLLWMQRKKIRDLYYLLMLLVVALIPTVIHEGTSIVLRSNIFIPIFILVSAIGVSALLYTNYRLKKCIIICFGGLACISLFLFQHYYFTIYPLQTIDAMFFKDRLLANYITRIYKPNQKIIVFADEPFNTTREIAYYDHLITPQTVEKWQKILKDPKQNTYVFNDLTITSVCTKETMQNKDEILIASPNHTKLCKFDAQYATGSASFAKEIVILSSPRDNLSYYRIYKDPVCDLQTVPNYIQIKNEKELHLDSLQNTVFCHQWAKKEPVKK